MCDNGSVNGVTKNGGYAQYVLLNYESAVRVPENVDAAKYAPILCAGVTVFNSIRVQKVPPGSTVAIQGLGGLGHLAIQYANKFGYRVIALSRDDKKEEFARKLGAHEYIDGSKTNVTEALQKLGGADLIVSTAPSKDAVSGLLAGLAPLGKLLLLAPTGEIPIDSFALLQYGRSVTSWPAGHQLDTEEAIAFTQLEGIDCMIQTWPLEKAAEAYEAMSKGTVRFRAVITPE